MPAPNLSSTAKSSETRCLSCSERIPTLQLTARKLWLHLCHLQVTCTEIFQKKQTSAEAHWSSNLQKKVIDKGCQLPNNNSNSLQVLCDTIFFPPLSNTRDGLNTNPQTSSQTRASSHVSWMLPFVSTFLKDLCIAQSKAKYPAFSWLSKNL